jgi:DNA processing protein
MALSSHAKRDWHLVAQLVEETGSALALVEGRLSGFEPPELLAAVDEAGYRVGAEELASFALLIERAEERGAALVTVLDEGYPTNLRQAYDRPPYLFIRGELRPEDERALAVVGTRSASPAGIDQAQRFARDLVEHGVTVISGLARGIDTAAHKATLAAGGRTIAVLGTGIEIVYPRENVELAQRIVESGGALVSQFPPEAPPTRFRFPLRNRTMSGLALGTIVIEASHTSGARMQARIALEHGKRAFLVSGLVSHERWAQTFLEKRPGANEVASADEVLAIVDALEPPIEQLSLV